MTDFPDLTPKKRRAPPAHIWRPRFIAAFRRTGNVTDAAAAAGVERATAYWAREHSPEFRAEWELALADAVDLLEAEAWKRALTVSDTLLIFLLKAHRPALYRDVYRIDITAAVRQAAIATGLDPDEAVRAAEAIIASK